MTAEKKTTSLYIVRHGQTDWNLARILQGHSDIELNAAGLEEARQLAGRLLHIPFQTVVSSDLLRARQTAETIAGHFGLQVNTHPGLRERSYGSFEGKPHHEYDPVRDLLAKMDPQTRKHYRHKDEETEAEAMDRFIPALQQIVSGDPGDIKLVVTHGSVMRIFITGLNLPHLQKPQIGNTAFIRLDSDGENFIFKESEGITDQP